MCLSTPKAPKVEAPPPIVREDDMSIQNNLTEERRRRQLGGAKSTILTGPSGLLPAGMSQQKTLLGP